jgi:hypothetical protein
LQQFNEAAQSVKNLTKRPSDEELLEAYALYKQATVGDNNTGNAQDWWHWELVVETRPRCTLHRSLKYQQRAADKSNSHTHSKFLQNPSLNIVSACYPKTVLHLVL